MLHWTDGGAAGALRDGGRGASYAPGDRSMGHRHRLVALALASLAACGFPKPDDVKNKALPVGGTVHGLWTGTNGVALRLVADGNETFYTVPTTGTFTFPHTLDEGVTYTVSVAADPARHACTLRAGASGTVSPDGVTSIEVGCVGPAVSLELSAPQPWTLDPSIDVQPALRASVVLQGVVLTIRSPDGALTSARVAGTAVALGTSSALQLLALGSNSISVDLTAQGGLSKTYEIPIERGASTIEQTVYAKASNTGENAYFGNAVAISGDTLVVGASGESSSSVGVNGAQTDTSAPSAGAAYVFRRVAGSWKQEAYLKSFNTQTFDDFGSSVAISGDTIVVGAPGEDSNATGVDGNPADNTASFSGAAYIFHRIGTTWTQQAYLKASNTRAQAGFGWAVAVSEDTVAVGSYAESSPSTGINGGQGSGAPGAGAVYIFSRTGTAWDQTAYLKASNTDAGDGFGRALALSGDTLAVGAAAEDSSATGANGDQSNNDAMDSGAVYVFFRTGFGGFTWLQQAYLKASNTRAMGYFGASIAISGNTLAVGAVGESGSSAGINGAQNDASAPQAGAVYIFVRANSAWSQDAYVKASNPRSGSEFASAVAIHGDNLAVASHFEPSSSTGINADQTSSAAATAGAVYAFKRTAGAWTQQAYIKASNTGTGDQFGESVALSEDTLAVGAYGEGSSATGLGGDQTSNALRNPGACYLFR